MAIDHVFRSTPQLGPALIAHDDEFWFNPPETYDNGSGATDNVDVSYRLGNPEKGTDGHVYVMVVAGAGFSAGDGLTLDETTWTATAGTGPFFVPDDIEDGTVASGDYFHARKGDPAVTDGSAI